MKTLEQLKAMWDAQADAYNRWCTLGHDEIVKFAQEVAAAGETRRRARFDAALTVCRSAVRVIESSAYQGVSDEDCDLENSVRNWQAVERANRQQELVNAAFRAHET